MNFARAFGCIVLCALVSGCLESLPFRLGGTTTRVDELPMYGGMDRSKVPELKAGDEKFIADVTAQFGSRERASDAWTEQGFEFYRQDKLDMAMRRFNQAWLLNPSNPEVYSGFASILSDQRKFCEAKNMLDIGFAKGPIQDGFLADAALIYTACPVQNTSMNSAERQTSFRRSDELLQKAFSSPTVRKTYVLNQWVKVLLFREDYARAWQKVFEHRKVVGSDIDPRVLAELRSRMPEPRQ